MSKKRELEETKAELERSKKKYYDLLSQHQDIVHGTSFKSTENILSKKIDLLHLYNLNVKDRRDIYDRYMTELGAKSREEAAQHRDENIERFMELLKENNCDYTKRFRDIVIDIQDDPRCRILEKTDRYTTWDKYVNLKKKEYKNEHIKEILSDIDLFHTTLKDKMLNGLIYTSTSWINIRDPLKVCKWYRRLRKYNESLTKIYDDYMSTLKNELMDPENDILSELKNRKVELLPNFKYERIKDFLLSGGQYIKNKFKKNEEKYKLAFYDLLGEVYKYICFRKKMREGCLCFKKRLN